MGLFYLENHDWSNAERVFDSCLWPSLTAVDPSKATSADSKNADAKLAPTNPLTETVRSSVADSWRLLLQA